MHCNVNQQQEGKEEDQERYDNNVSANFIPDFGTHLSSRTFLTEVYISFPQSGEWRLVPANKSLLSPSRFIFYYS
jgi:hypothetical protein